MKGSGIWSNFWLMILLLSIMIIFPQCATQEDATQKDAAQKNATPKTSIQQTDDKAKSNITQLTSHDYPKTNMPSSRTGFAVARISKKSELPALNFEFEGISDINPLIVVVDEGRKYNPKRILLERQEITNYMPRASRKNWIFNYFYKIEDENKLKPLTPNDIGIKKIKFKRDDKLYIYDLTPSEEFSKTVMIFAGNVFNELNAENGDVISVSYIKVEDTFTDSLKEAVKNADEQRKASIEKAAIEADKQRNEDLMSAITEYKKNDSAVDRNTIWENAIVAADEKRKITIEKAEQLANAEIKKKLSESVQNADAARTASLNDAIKTADEQRSAELKRAAQDATAKYSDPKDIVKHLEEAFKKADERRDTALKEVARKIAISLNEETPATGTEQVWKEICAQYFQVWDWFKLYKVGNQEYYGVHLPNALFGIRSEDGKLIISGLVIGAAWGGKIYYTPMHFVGVNFPMANWSLTPGESGDEKVLQELTWGGYLDLDSILKIGIAWTLNFVDESKQKTSIVVGLGSALMELLSK